MIERLFTEAEVRKMLLLANIWGWQQCKRGDPAPTPEEMLKAALAEIEKAPK